MVKDTKKLTKLEKIAFRISHGKMSDEEMMRLKEDMEKATEYEMRRRPSRLWLLACLGWFLTCVIALAKYGHIIGQGWPALGFAVAFFGGFAIIIKLLRITQRKKFAEEERREILIYGPPREKWIPEPKPRVGWIPRRNFNKEDWGKWITSLKGQVISQVVFWSIVYILARIFGWIPQK